MDVHFIAFQRLLKNRQKWDSFSAHYEKYFESTASHMDLHNCVEFNVLNNLNSIGEMKSFMKFNCYLCIDDCLTIQKKISDERISLMNKKNGDIGPARTKALSVNFA